MIFVKQTVKIIPSALSLSLSLKQNKTNKNQTKHTRTQTKKSQTQNQQKNPYKKKQQKPPNQTKKPKPHNLYFYYCLHMSFVVLLAFWKNTVMALVSCFSESRSFHFPPVSKSCKGSYPSKIRWKDLSPAKCTRIIHFTCCKPRCLCFWSITPYALGPIASCCGGHLGPARRSHNSS